MLCHAMLFFFSISSFHVSSRLHRNKLRGVFSERELTFTWKRCKIGGKLILITNRKSYMSFRLVPKSVTLNDLERRNGRYIALFH